MEHKKVFKKIGAFHDNALHAAEAKAVSEHISLCEICRGELETLKKNEKELLSVKHEADIDPYFASRVMNAYKQKEKMKIVPYKLLPVPVALSVFVIVLISVMAASPFVYSVDAENTKREIGTVLLASFIPDNPSRIFSPVNVMAFCGGCNEVLCGCCKKSGDIKCPAKRCTHGK